MATPKSPTAIVCEERLPGQRFKKDDIRQAGRILAKHGEEAAVAFLDGKGTTGPQPNFQPPVKCNIVAMSRPLDQWPIYKATEAIQKYTYAQSYDDFNALNPGTSKASFETWLKATRVDTAGFFHVQGLGKIFRTPGAPTKVSSRRSRTATRKGLPS